MERSSCTEGNVGGVLFSFVENSGPQVLIYVLRWLIFTWIFKGKCLHKSKIFSDRYCLINIHQLVSRKWFMSVHMTIFAIEKKNKSNWDISIKINELRDYSRQIIIFKISLSQKKKLLFVTGFLRKCTVIFINIELKD